MKTLLLDVDGVIADCSSAVHNFAQQILGRDLPPPATWTSWDHAEAMGLDQAEARYFHASAKLSKFPHEIKLYPGSAESLRELKKHFRVCFVTAPWKGCTSWVVARENLLDPFGCPIVFTKHKHLVKGDCLVDDSVDNIRASDHRLRLLFDAPYNQDDKEEFRIHSLRELLDYA